MLVEHSLHAACVGTREDNIAGAESTALHEHGGHIATALVERGLNDRTHGLLVGVGLEVEQLGLQEHLLKEFVEVDTLLGRNLLRLVLTAPILHEVVHIGQLLFDSIGVGRRFVNLVDCEHHRYACSHSVVDSLHGLGHHLVIGSHNDDGHIGNLCTTSTHSGKSLVSGGIKEGDGLALILHAVGTDVLGDTTCLTGRNVGLADVVQERGLTVVHVAHNGNNGRALHEVLLAVGRLLDGLLNVHAHELNLEAILLGHNHKCLGIEPLVDGYHKAEVHTGSDDVSNAHVHHRGKVAHGYELGEFEHLALVHLLLKFGLHTLPYLLAFLLAVDGAFALITPCGEPCKGVLNLLLNLLIAHLGANNGFWSILLLVLLVLLAHRLYLLLAATLRLATLLGLTTTVLGFGNIHLVFDAFALLTVGVATLAETIHINLTQHLGACEFGALHAEYLFALGHPFIIGLGLGLFVGHVSLLFGLGRSHHLGCHLHVGLLGLGFGCGSTLGLLLLLLCFGHHRLSGLLAGLDGCFGFFLGLGRLCLFLLGLKVNLTQHLGATDLGAHSGGRSCGRCGGSLSHSGTNGGALDYYLFLVGVGLCGSLLAVVQRHALLLEVDALTNVVPLTSEVATTKLLLQKRIDIALHQSAGRNVCNTLFVQKIGNGTQTYLKLSCNLYESQFSLHLLLFLFVF